MIYIILSLILLIVLFSYFAKNMKPTNQKMSKSEASEVLGIEESATKEEVISAFNILMKKNHPDVGGSKYLAQKIIIAKKTLIDE